MSDNKDYKAPVMMYTRCMIEDIEGIEISPAAVDRLEGVKKMKETLEIMTLDTVREARVNGATWQEIGEALGVTKQAAQQRYGHYEQTTSN